MTAYQLHVDGDCGDSCPVCAHEPADVYGMCTACGAVEVRLDQHTGTRDLSGIGEHEAYPTGYGCEVCS